MTDPAFQPVSDQLQRVAHAVEQRQDAATVAALATARQLCVEQAASQAKATRALLDDMAQRLQVWHDVWPRLGKDAGFRQAVAREARLWATKLPSGTR